MKYHYVWLVWSSTFVLLWIGLYLWNAPDRKVIWRTSLATALLGLTEPLFVPEYWNPPSLFHLAQRTGFDIESLIFSFGIGGIGVVLYNTFTGKHLVAISTEERHRPRHRIHLTALFVPYILFVPLYFLPWNPIYPSIVTLIVAAIASVACRPGLKRETLIGGILFFGLYTMFMLGLKWFTPGYIERTWNLPALSGGLVYGIPLEELVFGFSFGLYWTGVYEHFTWSRRVSHAEGLREKLVMSERQS